MNLTGDEYGADGGGFAIECNWMVNMVMVMGGQLNVIGLMCSVAFFVDNAIWWRAVFLRCTEFVIQLIALLFGSRCFLDRAAFWDHNDFCLRALVIYWD